METVNYLAYVHARPNTTSADHIFYVGKGSKKRAYDLRPSTRSSNKHHANIVKKYGRDNVLVGTIECSSEEIALELERGLIKCLRRMGVDLTNKTDGGEGVSGYVAPDDLRKRLSEIQRKANNLPARKIVQSENSKANWSDPEYISKVKLGLQKSWDSETRRKNQSDKLRAHRMSPEERIANSERQKVAQNRPDVLAKQRTARVGRIWVNNGTSCKWVFEDVAKILIENGWQKGRLMVKK